MPEILLQEKPPKRVERVVINSRGNLRDVLVGKINEKAKEDHKQVSAEQFPFASVETETKKLLTQYVKENIEVEDGYEEWALSFLSKYNASLLAIVRAVEESPALPSARTQLQNELQSISDTVEQLSHYSKEQKSTSQLLWKQLKTLLQRVLNHIYEKDMAHQFEAALISLQSEVKKSTSTLNESIKVKKEAEPKHEPAENQEEGFDGESAPVGDTGSKPMSLDELLKM